MRVQSGAKPGPGANLTEGKRVKHVTKLVSELRKGAFGSGGRGPVTSVALTWDRSQRIKVTNPLRATMSLPSVLI